MQDHKLAISRCQSIDELEAYVNDNPKALNVVYEICEHWIYEALVIRKEGEC